MDSYRLINILRKSDDSELRPEVRRARLQLVVLLVILAVMIGGIGLSESPRTDLGPRAAASPAAPAESS